jgi:hypothetical protein
MRPPKRARGRSRVALRIREVPEPLSLASYDLQREWLVIGSNASRLLIQELRRYCRREITGRSFLISGHRGAGKTTLVNSAILEAWKESERSGARGRPLFVPIHGPSLFRMASGKDSAAPAADKPAGLDPASEEVLKQTILCLHRAVAHEVAGSFRRRVIETASTERQRREGLELAAQLAVELYECPGPMRLREIWSRGGFLDGSSSGVSPGVLFRTGGEDQGLRELVAVSGACEAFRRISGTYQSKETTEDAAKTKAEAAIGTEVGKDLFGPVLSLLTGGLVGTGVTLAGAGGIEATLAGIMGALGASTVFKISGSRSRDRSVSRERTFLFDFTVATLDRALPILIERLQDAGLAPVFVVDELDKVEHLSDRILWMVHYLKKLVAEHAFFCFLTDRGYYEEMIRRGESHPYPVEYTYFMHRLFVVFQPRDFHAYLDEILELPRPAAPAPDAEQTALIVQDGLVAEDRTDRLFLRYVMLHQSQMHALDLQRQLVSLRGPDGTVALGGVALRDRPAFKVAVVMQLAIDMVLERSELADRLAREPEFGRLVNDALYYLSRRWKEDPGKELSLAGDQEEAEFGKYLEKRMGREEKVKTKDTISNRDRGLLFQFVRELAATLASRGRYEHFFQAWNDLRERKGQERIDASVLDVLPEEGPPLLFLPDDERAYLWLYDVDGREVPHAEFDEAVPLGLALETVPPEPDWKTAVAFINDFAQDLAELTGEVDLSTLSSHLRIISTSPAWPTVQNAITNLRRYGLTGQAYDSLQNDIRCVQQYARLLEGRADTIAQALVCGLVIGLAVSAKSRGSRILVGLDVVSRAHRFSEKTDLEVEQVLTKLLQELRRHEDLSKRMEACPDKFWKVDSRAWSADFEKILSRLEMAFEKGVIDNVHERAWDSWLRRIDLFFQGARRPEPELNDLLALAAQSPAARLFKLDLREMTVGDWSAALVEAVVDPHYPLWTVVASLQALGFDDSWITLVLAESSKATNREPKGLALDRLNAWSRFLPPSPERSILILKRAGRSPIDGWLPSSNAAALVVSNEQALHLIEFLGRWTGRAEARLDAIGFEMPLVPPDLDNIVERFAQSSFGLKASPPNLYIYDEVPRAAPLRPFVIAPKSADELFPTAPPA